MLLAAFLQLGTIVFPNSGKPEAQDAFLRGVLLLHNFAYPQAKDAFVEAEKIDPKFALAYWGEAMTHNHPIWNQQDINKGRTVLDKVKNLHMTTRERAYIDALAVLYGDGEKKQRDYAYEKAMQRLARANPNDLEAQVFWALSILGSREWHQLDERRSIAAAAILEPLFPTHADHSGILHYLIHAYDDPIHAPLGLRAARLYSKVASSAPHALHMPSHIFLQLGMWEDAAKSNEAAYSLSKQWGEPDLHSLSWLQYAYLQQHRYEDARRLLDEVSTDNQHASGVRETMQVRYAVQTGDYTFDFTSPVGKALRAIAEKRFDDAQKSIDESAKNSDEPDADELRALLASARGQMDVALHYAESAIKLEENLGVPSGPPNFKPAHELYGELLLKAGRKKEAAEQFQMSLLRTPNRAASLAGAQRVSQ